MGIHHTTTYIFGVINFHIEMVSTAVMSLISFREVLRSNVFRRSLFWL